MSAEIPVDAVNLLVDRFGLTVDDHQRGPWVPREQGVAVATALKEELDFRFFVYCAAAHFPETDDDPDHCLVAYRVRRFGPNAGTVPFRFKVPQGETCPSLAGVWAGADWQEREQFDLVGPVFAGHPDLRRIMMPEDWPGHPLRRDYAIDTQHFPWR